MALLLINNEELKMAKLTKLAKISAKTSDFISTKEGELRWVFIDQPGKPNKNGIPCLNASVFVKKNSKGLKKLKSFIQTFWVDNKPSGAPKKPKSTGIRPVKVKVLDSAGNETYDENDEVVYDFTGEVAINFWTKAQWPAKDDKAPEPHIINIYNAKGNVISLGNKKIGNGSFGAVSFTASIYDQGEGSQGITLFLVAIQLTQFVEYAQDAGFEAEEGDFDGVATEFNLVEENKEAKPRL